MVNQVGVRDGVVPIANIEDSTKQNVIVTTEDKAELCLRDLLEGIEKSRGYQTPLAVALTLFISLTTTDFKDSFGLEADFIRHFFILFFLVSILYGFFKLWQRLSLKKPTPKDFFDMLKSRADASSNRISRSD